MFIKMNLLVNDLIDFKVKRMEQNIIRLIFYFPAADAGESLTQTIGQKV